MDSPPIQDGDGFRPARIATPAITDDGERQLKASIAPFTWRYFWKSNPRKSSTNPSSKEVGPPGTTFLDITSQEVFATTTPLPTILCCSNIYLGRIKTFGGENFGSKPDQDERTGYPPWKHHLEGRSTLRTGNHNWIL